MSPLDVQRNGLLNPFEEAYSDVLLQAEQAGQDPNEYHLASISRSEEQFKDEIPSSLRMKPKSYLPSRIQAAQSDD